ncbi:MAG: exopolysaccharide biosynthesis polyprenyl glycosylphosphotransferase [Candidatus Korobacteraceae bacterium]
MLKIGGQKVPGLTLLLILSEALLIAAGLFLATILHFMDYAAVTTTLSTPNAFIRFVLVVLVCICCLYYYDLYDLQIVARRSVLFVRLLQALGTACLLLALLYFWKPDLSLGRGVAANAAPIVVVCVLGWRLFMDASAPFLRRSERVVILGTGSAGLRLAEEIVSRPELNLHLVGFLEESRAWAADAAVNVRPIRVGAAAQGVGAEQVIQGAIAMNAAAIAPTRMSGQELAASVATQVMAVATGNHGDRKGVSFTPKIVGLVEQVEAVAKNERVDRVVLSLSERRGRMPVQALLRMKFAGIKIEDAHNCYERITGQILLDHLFPSWLILSDGFQKRSGVLACKRITDIVVSAAALVLCLPIMALVGFAVWAEDGLPVLFRQTRLGLHNKPFEIFKFRSMRRTRPGDQPAWTSESDARITRVGKFIRKFRLDELPQFINVLRGEMSLIGPRPEQPSFCRMLETKIPYYGQRHSLRPGITGWAQVKFHYGASVEETETKLEHDLFYIKHMSLLLDLAIVVETFKVLLSGRGAK